MSGKLEIQTLGSLAVVVDGQPVSGFDTRKVQALLVYLACTERTYPRDVLAEMLWEDRTQSRSLANLRVAITSLRQTVGDFVKITRDTVSMSAEADWWLDVTAFEHGVDGAGSEAVALARAVDLYQGDFLSGFYVDSTAFDNWATRERERLRLRVMESLDNLIDCHLNVGDFSSGIARATQLLNIDSLREETYRQLMMLMWHSGQRAAALEQYKNCRQMLADELGVDPSPETEALYEQIRAGEAPARVGQPPKAGQLQGFELRGRIGRGGFGEVYRAYQPVIEREVAIKFIKPEVANQPDFVRRFEAEAQLVARLEHPNIVPLYDYWRDPGGAYLVMRLLRESLHDRIARGPLSLHEGVRLVEQIAAALTVAHRNNVVHRDLKPANILLDDDGNAYLTDFGLAKVLGPVLKASHEGLVMGSPAYLAPEQIRSEPVSASTDIYSFGVTLYETLTGQSPFPVDLLPSSLLYKKLNEPLPSLLELRPDLPPALDSVIQTATAQHPAERYPDALSLAVAFRMAVGMPQQGQMVGETEGPSAARVVAPPDSPVTPAESLVVTRNPYKGLRAFTEADTDDFFGREELTQHLLACLSKDDPMARFLAVVGPSGSGKSSVIRAGVIPALRWGQLPGSEDWFVAEMLPGSHPLDELEIALLRISVTQQSGLMEQLQRDERGLIRAAQLCLPRGAELVLLIDQFEEAFMLAEDPGQTRHLLDLIHAAVMDPRSGIRVLVTLRADFYDRPLMFENFSKLMQQRTEVVTPLSSEEIERAVTGPAESVGVYIQPRLVEAIIAEVHQQPGALPMLQYALTEMFDRRQDHALTLETYQALGGVMGVLAKQADEVYRRLDANQQNLARQLFLRLVTLGEGTEDTRRRARRSELLPVGGPEMERVIEAFDRSRLLTLDRDPANRAPTVEIAHEALLREWQQLRQWLDQNRDNIRLQRRVALAATEWTNFDRDPSYLATGRQLNLFESFAASEAMVLNEVEVEYLEASIATWRAQQAREAALEQRARRRLWGLVMGLTVFLGLAVVLMLFAFGEQREQKRQAAAALLAEANAEQKADEMRSLLWANSAQQALDDDHLRLALPLALAANRIDSPPVFAQRILAEIAYAPGPIRRLAGHTGDINSVAYSPDGRYALSGAYDNRLILWDLQTGTIEREFPLQRAVAVRSVAFNPRGQQVLAGLQDGLLILWGRANGQPLRQFAGHTQAIYSVAFSPDGRWVMSGSQDRTVIVWNVETGEQVRVLAGHTDGVSSVAYSPDGQRILSGSWDGSVRVWDAASGEVVHQLDGHTASVYSVAFSPDGRRILSGSGDETVILWDAVTGGRLATLSGGHSQRILAVAVSADGRRAISGSDDGLVVLWDLDSQTPRLTLRGHAASVNAVAFSPGEAGWPLTALSGGDDNTLILWRIDHGALLSTWLGHTGAVLDVAFSPDGQRAVTASSDNTLIVWEVQSGTPLMTLRGHTERVQSVAYSPDGAVIVSGARDNTVRLWDAVTGAQLANWQAHGSYVNSVIFSPDGRLVLSGSQDQEVIVWGRQTGEILHRLRSPGGAVTVAVFSPGGDRIMAGGADGNLVLWDAVTGERTLSLLDGHNDFVRTAAFSPDGQTILSGAGDGTLVIWDAITGARLRTLSEHSDEVTSVAFHPSGQMAISGSRDGTLIVWGLSDRERGVVLARLIADKGQVNSVEFSPDGRTALAAFSDKTVAWWRIDAMPEGLMAWVYAEREVRELTCPERDTYLVDPYCNNAGMYPTRTPFPMPVGFAIPQVLPSAVPEGGGLVSPSQPTPVATLATSTPELVQPSPTALVTIQPTATLAPTAQAVPLGELRVGQTVQAMAHPGDRVTWTFEGEAGQVVLLVNNSFNVSLVLYDPQNGVLAGPTSGEGIGPVTLPSSGTYTVLGLADDIGLFMLTLTEQTGE